MDVGSCCGGPSRFSILILLISGLRTIGKEANVSWGPGNHSKSNPGSRFMFLKPELHKEFKNWCKTISFCCYPALIFSKNYSKINKTSKLFRQFFVPKIVYWKKLVMGNNDNWLFWTHFWIPYEILVLKTHVFENYKTIYRIKIIITVSSEHKWIRYLTANCPSKN